MTMDNVDGFKIFHNQQDLLIECVWGVSGMTQSSGTNIWVDSVLPVEMWETEERKIGLEKKIKSSI